MKLLVVTPTLGTSPWFAETVRSVAALSLPLQHVVVAPDSAVDSLRAAFPTISVVNESAAGMYAALNRGAAAVPDWDLFTYINDDDILLPGFSRVVQSASRDYRVPLLVYGRVQLIDSRGRRVGTVPVSRLPSINRALLAQRIEPVHQQGSIVTRAAWDRLGGFDDAWRFCGDSEFLARACTSGIESRYVNRLVGCFRLRAGQLTKSRIEMERERAMIDARLALCEGIPLPARIVSRAVFRASNAGCYLERTLRHGFWSFSELLTRLG